MSTIQKELIIDASRSEVNIALLENKKLVELHTQVANSEFNVGDIFLGRVTKLNNGLNAAFVEIGHEKEAFLHYTDMGPSTNNFVKFTNEALHGNIDYELRGFKNEPDIIKSGKIDQVLKKKQPLLVQILKEPISSKGPRLTLEISIAGRFIVLTPFVRGINVSRKITSNEERKRLSKILEAVNFKNFGVIVRTAAEGATTEDLQADYADVILKWKQITANLKNADTPTKILGEMNKTGSLIRDLLSNDFQKIAVNNETIYKEIESYLTKIAPDKKKIIELVDGSKSVFDTMGVTKQIKSSFGKTSNTARGSYIVIEHTEAMAVIDVNSGMRFMGEDQDGTALQVNLEVCEEIARQLRLRDIGGLIVIDFIDMKNPDYRKKVYEKMEDCMRADAMRHTILPISKFGLMQITRERSKPVLNIETKEVCPSCKGSGKISPTILIEDEIERNLSFIINRQNPKKLVLHVHPYIKAFLTKDFISKPIQWWWLYKKWITIREDSKLDMVQYKFYNELNDEIKLS